MPLSVSSWSGGNILDLFGSYKKVKILEALDDKVQMCGGSWSPWIFLKIMLILVREVRARNVGVTVTVGTGTPESWGQFDVEEPSQASLGISQPLGCFLSQLLVTLVPLKIFTLQAAW